MPLIKMVEKSHLYWIWSLFARLFNARLGKNDG